MPKMSNVYRVTFSVPDTEPTTHTIQVEAMTPEVAVRLARRSLALPDTAVVQECLDQGAWNKFYK